VQLPAPLEHFKRASAGSLPNLPLENRPFTCFAVGARTEKGLGG